jgi:hypothetical protein
MGKYPEERTKTIMVLDPACVPYHREGTKLPYVAKALDAERRIARGEKQRKCPACGLLVWESFFKVDDRGRKKRGNR